MHPPPKAAAASWSVFHGWKPPSNPIHPHPVWRVFRQWISDAERGRVGLQERLNELRGEWSKRLAGLGGDPGACDWSSFRPLRLSREEDWSDWLTHLIQESQEGEFARFLFEMPGEGKSREF